MKFCLSLLLCVFAVSCASPGVVQTGSNSYMISRTSAGGIFADRTKLKYDTIREANAFASKQGKIAEGTGGSETLPRPGVLPAYEYQFKLVSPKAGGGGHAVPSSVIGIQHEQR